MRFENISRKKENSVYYPGNVLIVYNETLCEEEVYMVICKYGRYNILNLDSGVAYYNKYENYDDFVMKLGRIFASVEIIDNDELELVRVED